MAMKIPQSNDEKIRLAMSILATIINDTGVPRNIRRAAVDAMTYLRDLRLSPAVRAANAVNALEEVSQDPNMPFYARTRIWQVITILENVRD